MEEKQFDPYQFIGFILIAMILTWMLFKNQNPPLSDESVIDTNNLVLKSFDLFNNRDIHTYSYNFSSFIYG